MKASQLTIWVVDDDPSIRWVLERAFRQEGFAARGFDSAEQLLEALAGERPDVIITDIRMPGMDGLKLLDRLGSDPQRLVHHFELTGDMSFRVQLRDADGFENRGAAS